MNVEIIAEIGVNADGSVEKAKTLVDAAIEAGADTVKFQATYPRIEMSQRLMPERIAETEKTILTHWQLNDVLDYCNGHQVEWLVTPSEESSLGWLMSHAPKRIKIGSDNLTNIPFLREVASYRLPVILSTGMGTWDEITAAVDDGWDGVDLTLMHCTSAYPCPLAEANLRVISELRRLFGFDVGWSDHTTSPLVAVAAVTLGAVAIEKHITLDINGAGPDHKASIDPLHFAIMVRGIREAEKALGDGLKIVQPSEIENRKVTRKSLMARRKIAPGTILSELNVIIQRPGIGRPPSEFRSILGQHADRAYEEGEPI